MAAATSDSINNTIVQQAQSKTTRSAPSALCIRIISVVLITLAIIAAVGSCAALILTTNLWFLLLSAVAGVCLSFGIVVNFALPIQRSSTNFLKEG
ncbi:hypothetical protein [Chlamydia sp. 04-14]|uniref:hypothetical protein n=1 Tax=Chlamydia TaxID=810 RepID=UPI002FCA862A